MNKQATAMVGIMMYIFLTFFAILFLGLYVFGFSLISDQLNTDVDVGQVNLRDANQQTFGALSDALVLNADILGIVILLGMTLVMILNGYFTAGRHNILWLVIDFFVLIFAFILSVYIAQVYDLVINSTALLDVYINSMPKSSKFILNLPIIVSTVGALTMVATYAPIRKSRATNVLGFS